MDTTNQEPKAEGYDFLSAFGLGPRKCEDCGETFTVPPYMEFAKFKVCTPCKNKRFHEWIKTPEAKIVLESIGNQ